MNVFEQRKLIQKERYYELASRIAIKYGGKGYGIKNYKPEYIREFWKYDERPPSLFFISSKAKVSEIKWFIHNKLNYEFEEIWNADFLMGLTVHGKIIWNLSQYPSFRWFENDVVGKLIQSCPFGGTLKNSNWLNVPALYLKHSKESLSYMAGVMAGAQVMEKDGFQYAKFSRGAFSAIRSFGIPIDQFSKNKRYALISPIWPALFTLKMPEFCNTWLSLKKPYGVKLYAPILWHTYVDNKFPRRGIPYLPSMRTVWNHFYAKDGAWKRVERMRVEKGLTELDNRVKEIIGLWKKKLV